MSGCTKSGLFGEPDLGINEFEIHSVFIKHSTSSLKRVNQTTVDFV